MLVLACAVPCVRVQRHARPTTLHTQVPLLYVKPVQTGFPGDSDARTVALACGVPETTGEHARYLLPASSPAAATDASLTASRVVVSHAWAAPTSPHLTARREGRPVSDGALLAALSAELRDFQARTAPGAGTSTTTGTGAPAARSAGGESANAVPAGAAAAGTSAALGPPLLPRGMALVESAGGVASPAPSGTLQVGAYVCLWAGHADCRAVCTARSLAWIASLRPPKAHARQARTANSLTHAHAPPFPPKP